MAENQVYTLRDQEGLFIIKSAIYKTVIDFFIFLTPFLVSIAVFGTYVTLGNTLTPAKAYTVLSLFNIMQVTYIYINIYSIKYIVTDSHYYYSIC